VAAQQNNLPELYLYCNSYFTRDVHGEFGLMSVCIRSTYCLQFRVEKSGKSWDIFLSEEWQPMT